MKICAALRDRQRTPGFIVTPGNGAKNQILGVNEDEGYVELLSERSRSGKPRRIYRSQMSPSDRGASATAHGAMVRTLWKLIEDEKIDDDESMAGEAQVAYSSSSAVPRERAGTTAEHWQGPLRIGSLLGPVADEQRPPERGGLLLVSRHAWEGEPGLECRSYLMWVLDRGASLRGATGRLLTELAGLQAGTEKQFPGGPELRAVCRRSATAPADLYLSWLAGPACVSCAAEMWLRRLWPLWSTEVPLCPEHGVVVTWESLRGIAGQGTAEELEWLNDHTAGDPGLIHALWDEGLL